MRGLGAGLLGELGLELLRVGERRLDHLLALAARLADHLLVLGEEGLGLGPRALRPLHGVADGLLPLLDHGQERLPAELRQHDREEQEQDDRP